MVLVHVIVMDCWSRKDEAWHVEKYVNSLNFSSNFKTANTPSYRKQNMKTVSIAFHMCALVGCSFMPELYRKQGFCFMKIIYRSISGCVLNFWGPKAPGSCYYALLGSFPAWRQNPFMTLAVIFPVIWILVQYELWWSDRHPPRQWCIRAHRAIGSGGLKNWENVFWQKDNLLTDITW